MFVRSFLFSFLAFGITKIMKANANAGRGLLAAAVTLVPTCLPRWLWMDAKVRTSHSSKPPAPHKQHHINFLDQWFVFFLVFVQWSTTPAHEASTRVSGLTAHCMARRTQKTVPERALKDERPRCVIKSTDGCRLIFSIVPVLPLSIWETR